MIAYTLRPLHPSDWPAVFAAAMAAIPDAEAENREWLANRQAIAAGETRHHHCVVEDQTGAVIGFGAVEEGPHPGAFRVYVVGAPEETTGEMGTTVFDYLSDRLLEFGAELAWVREEARDPVVHFFESVGFRETGRFTLPNGRQAVVLEKK
jgi:L-amino acid N-acyltransferase YncA